ncbi:MAG: aconitate hydratase AcnA [Phycisphaerales bacterium]|nr:aconitate hydratase AcnA [Phycisphaerales bacterium]
MTARDPFNARATLKTAHGSYTYFDLNALDRPKAGRIARLPYSIRVLLEALLRNVDGFIVTADDVSGLADWNAKSPAKAELPFMPGRVVLQDFTGVPCVVDLAAMRDAMKKLGGDPGAINPLVPCDLVIDHSVQVDAFASSAALTINGRREFERNRERYEFLKWGQQSLRNFRCVPPATGIVHQVNLEYLSPGVLTRPAGAERVAYPDSCVGTDSHTTMINGLGVVGWGVGGIEAEAVMLGQPYYMVTPEVIGIRLTGRLPEGSTATDLVLTVTQMLRKKGVVEKFVEFFGPGIAALSIPDRATIANMAPEYGATIGFFPVDRKAVEFLRFTGRGSEADLTEAYCKANMLWWTPESPVPEFTDTLELDLSTVQPSLAGPRRPQDRVELRDMRSVWLKELTDSFGKKAPAAAVNLNRWAGEGGNTEGRPVNAAGNGPAAAAAAADPGCTGVETSCDGRRFAMHHGDVVIAAITSCTNTSNPDVMIAAGLVARKARALGLTRRPWVKTSLAPGSKVVTEYFDRAGLTEDLDAIGFNTVGYGCTTCIGNSGPLPDQIEASIRNGDLVVASVLSGNRNFEGRIHAAVKANYLASPPLVVAYAIAGTVDIDLAKDPLAHDKSGRPVYLKDLWPTHAEVIATRDGCLTPAQFEKEYGAVFTGNPEWNAVPVSGSDLYKWDADSTYIQNPPYFEGLTAAPPSGGFAPITSARCLVHVGDSVTTDHISPAGDIAEASPAGEYLKARGIRKADFNSYGSRRGNDRVMTRGTFANIRVKNQLAKIDDPAAPAQAGKIKEGWWTTDFSKAGGGKLSTIFDAAQNYKKDGTPLVVLAGKDYGMGSSRDWAAKGTMLLGVRAVIAESFERIHRSNLVGMGVLPFTFKPGQTAASLGLCGTDTFDIHLPPALEPRTEVPITATITRGDRKGQQIRFTAICRLDTPVEVEYSRNGGILQTVLRRLLNESKKPAMVGA